MIMNNWHTKSNNRILRSNYTKAIIPFIVVSALIITSNACKNKTAQTRGETSQEDVARQMEEAADTTMAYLSDERRELVETYESKLEDAELQIKEMKEEIKSAQADVRQDYQQKVHMLESQVAYVKQNIGELANASEQAWEDLSAGVDSAMVDLDQAIREAKDEIRDS
jgi:hypothetical protein